MGAGQPASSQETEDVTVGELLDDISRREVTLSNGLGAYQERIRDILTDSFS